MTVNGILEKYNPDALREKVNILSNTLKEVDVRVKGYGLDNNHNLRRHCCDCNKLLKTWKAKRCRSCHMKLVGSRKRNSDHNSL
jgi:rRNA maturation endonuclease Nob1